MSGSAQTGGRLATPIAKAAALRRKIRERGVVGAARYIRRRLFSSGEWLVLRHDMHCTWERTPLPDSITIGEADKGDLGLTDQILAAWPREFGSHKTEIIATRIAERFQRGDWCLTMCLDDQFAGMIWVSVDDEFLIHCPVDRSGNDRVMEELFLVERARGLGASKMLLGYALDLATERNVRQLFAFVYPWRLPSLRALSSAGFEVVGTLRFRVRLGRESFSYRVGDPRK